MKNKVITGKITDTNGQCILGVSSSTQGVGCVVNRQYCFLIIIISFYIE